MISSDIKFSKRLTGFTEQGVAVLSSVLNSPRAIQANIEIICAFVRLREVLATNSAVTDRHYRAYGTPFKVLALIHQI